MKKYLKFLLLVLVVAILVPLLWNWNIWSWFKTPTEQNSPKSIGGERDSHGCLVAAGYSWCEVKNKCLRSWEEKCEANQTVK